MNMTLPTITDVLPHRNAMLLLEKIISHDASRIVVQARPDANAWYADSNGNMPAYVGIELMAQAVAAWVGMSAHAAGLPVRQGVLLGTRRYQPSCSVLVAGEALQVVAEVAYRDESGMGSLVCQINREGQTLVEATISVFEPQDFEQFLQESSQ